ncbi:MAG: FecR domain-containing protein [Proteobacteria bacterium]|nr:FecR domain-containing protein [Pseudomonadota bacterium]
MNVQKDRRWVYPLLLLAAMLAVFPGLRAEAIEAGKVIFVKGPVSAERDPPVPLAKGDSVLVADAIVTGEAARAQLLMLDGAKVAIRPNSRLLIEEFLYASGEPVPEGTAVASASADRAVYRLIKGGFRSITGAIGKENEADYEVRTPVGTLGIRGTDYTVLFCQDDCESAPEAGGSSLQNGLHISVVAGIVVFRNEFGEVEITAGQKFVVPLTDRRPQRVGAPEETDGQDSGAGPRDDETPEIPIFGTDPDGNTMDLTDPKRNPGNRTISWSNGPLPLTLFSGFAGTQDNTPLEYILDAGNNLEGFVGPHPDATGGVVRANFAIGAAGNAETGFDSVTMLRWGRWSGGMASITLDTGADASQDLSQQSLHWISGPEWMTPPVIPLSGAVDYSLIGSTSPTNNLGEIGVVGSATFLADFTNMQVFNTLNLNIGQSIWVASGSGDIGARAGLPAHQFSGFYNNVTVDGFSTDFGFFSGFFSDPGNTSDPSLPGGVGLTYTLFDDLSQWVSGALVFGDPVPTAPPAGGGGP